MERSGSTAGRPASELIDARIAELGDWRGETLRRVRALIREADPDVAETWKWRGVPVWEHDGIICTGETYASKMFTRSPSIRTCKRSSIGPGVRGEVPDPSG